jgi:peroxiredoxin 2/4
MLKPGDPAPPFDLPCCEDDRLTRLSLAAIKPEMVVLFFYPRDFSFICPTEIVGFSRQREAFDAEQAQLIGISTDSAESHRRWAREIGAIAYPLLADEGGAVASAYGVFDPAEKTALRATFILNRDRIVVYSVASSVNVGRSVSETLRVLCALRSGRLCPADWHPGDEFGPAGQKF